MVDSTRPRFTLAEYVALEEMSNVKHEYVDGLIYAVVGGSPDHGAVCANVVTLLSVALRGRPCRVYSSDVRIRVEATGIETYPDVSVVWGQVERDPEDRNALVNPVVLFEVTSPNTAAYDRGEKLEHYQQIPSVAEVVIVAQEERRLEIWRRAGDVWSRETVEAGESARLESLEVELAVDEVLRDPLA